jgi:hypothetical protein
VSGGYVTLVGAESVQNAGHAISSAAGRMNDAAGTISHALRQHEIAVAQHEAFLSDWLARFEAAVEKMPRAAEPASQEPTS